MRFVRSMLLIVYCICLSSCMVMPNRIAIPYGASNESKFVISMGSGGVLICDLRRSTVDHADVHVDLKASSVRDSTGRHLPFRFSSPDYASFVEGEGKSYYLRVFAESLEGCLDDGIYNIRIVLQDISGKCSCYEQAVEVKTVFSTPCTFL